MGFILFISKPDAALKSLSFDATKLAMVFKQPPLPKPEDCNQMLAGAEGRIIVLVSLFYGIPKESGEHLSNQLLTFCLLKIFLVDKFCHLFQIFFFF